jgi:hypothetical protein
MFGILEKQAASMCTSHWSHVCSIVHETNKRNTCKAASKLTHQQQSNLCEDQSCKLEDGLLENTSESENYWSPLFFSTKKIRIQEPSAPIVAFFRKSSTKQFECFSVHLTHGFHEWTGHGPEWTSPPMTAPVGRSVHKDGLDDSPLYLTLTNIRPQSNFFWLLTFDHSFFCCQIFPNPDLHTTQPSGYPSDLNLSPAYELTINPLLTLAKLLFRLS